MNKEWSDLNKLMQQQLKKEDSYKDGIATLTKLRNLIFSELLYLKNTLTEEQFSEMPFANAKGYHNKTIAYSIWHIMRIEDIVAHTVICNDEQIFFNDNWQRKLCSPIITTGNELVKNEIVEFSQKLNVDALYDYADKVKKSTEKLLCNLCFNELKITVSENTKQKLIESDCVSKDENAVWLIDYWCGKNIRGLIQMPFSRHWIMHTEAALRIAAKF